MPKPNSLSSQHTGFNNAVVTQSASLPAFHVTATPEKSWGLIQAELKTRIETLKTKLSQKIKWAPPQTNVKGHT